ncbi:MAG: hypothetical protein K8R23_00895 [Chthoniobacter sp.]|nr:hypothetical protein [Chthoniobacter sp.]
MALPDFIFSAFVVLCWLVFTVALRRSMVLRTHRLSIMKRRLIFFIVLSMLMLGIRLAAWVCYSDTYRNEQAQSGGEHFLMDCVAEVLLEPECGFTRGSMNLVLTNLPVVVCGSTLLWSAFFSWFLFRHERN